MRISCGRDLAQAIGLSRRLRDRLQHRFGLLQQGERFRQLGWAVSLE